MIKPRKAILQRLALLGLSLTSAHLFAQTPIWSEEFNADRLDKSTWTFTTGGTGNGNKELQYYTADSGNAYTENGSLVIQAKREAYSGKSFTSARLKTQGRMSFKYGTLEARIKLPQVGNGLWPAFWMLGSSIGLDGWPKSGEMDILEAGATPFQTAGTVNKSISGALHWWDETGAGSQADFGQVTQLPTNFYDDYHLYKLDWTPTTITMYVDGTSFFTMDISAANKSEFREPAFVILNLAVGGNYVGISDPNKITAPLPGKMLVDYVRLYKNENTELHLPSDKVYSGNFGIMTETTPILDELNWGNRTNLYIWNNMTSVATVPSEGSNALGYSIAAGSWWGMGLLHKDYDMHNYTHGYLHFDIKTPSTMNMTVHVGSSAGGTGDVDLIDGAEQYGLVRDGNWHSVAIPLSKFGNVDFNTIKTFFSISGAAPAAATTIAFDNIYFSESIKLPTPELGSFGIYTENSAHKTAGDFGLGVKGDLFLWENTLSLQPDNVFEGNASLNLKSTGKGWYGMALTAREGFNLTAFDNASAALHFSMKTSETVPFKIGFKSGGQPDIGQKWINFTSGSDPYGFARDGQWHEIVIPMSTLAKDLDLFDVRQFLQVLGTTEINSLAIDDVYLSGGTLAKDPGTNGQVVNRAPTAVLQPSVMGGAAPLAVVLDGSKSNDVNGDTLTYSWDFGDGTTGTGSKPTHTFTQGGSYHVVLTVNDGQTTSTAKTIIFVDDNYGKTKSSKRGVGYGHHSPEDMAIMSRGISWWYNWGTTPDLAIKDTYQNYGVEYAPMTWGGNFDEAALRTYISTHKDVKYLLAFNEPQFVDQSNLTPTQVAALWPTVEKIADDYGLKIVSMALNFCGNCVKDPSGNPYYTPWVYLDDFLKICPTCRIDAISIHAYMPSVGGIQWYVNQFKKYGKPIWLTEFCAWEAATTLQTQEQMMTSVLDYLETDPSVQRYAWFIGRSNGHPYNSLLDYRQSGVLSELGDMYINMPIHGDATNVHTLPKLVEAEKYSTQNAPRANTGDKPGDNFTYTNGIRVEPTQDTSGFLDLTSTQAGDWVEYNVVSTATTYNVAARVAGETAGTINVLVDGAQKAVITVPAMGGLQTWTTVNSTLALTAGSHKVRFVFNQATNLNWVNFTIGTASSSSVASSSKSSVASSSSSNSSSSISVVSSSSKLSSSTSSVVSSSKASSSSSTITYLPNTNMALNRPVTASSNEVDARTAANAVDGNGKTRWSSLKNDAQWISVDLGAVVSFNKVVLNWESAYGKSYEIQTSTDGTTWTKVYSTTTGVGGKETLNVSGSGRYVRMFGIARGTGYGYSLWEFEVWSPASVQSSSASSTSVASSSKSSVSSSSSSVATGGNLALNRPVVSSSDERAGTAAIYAVDGNPTTRWSSQKTDAEWIYVDLGSVRSISRVNLLWQSAYGKAYNIQVSNDAVTWTTVKAITNGDGGVDDIAVSGSGRYVRIQGVTRGTGNGYSLYNFEVY